MMEKIHKCMKRTEAAEGRYRKIARRQITGPTRRIAFDGLNMNVRIEATDKNSWGIRS